MAEMIVRSTSFHGAQHLDDRQLMPADPACPLCGSVERSAIHILQEAPRVSLLKCSGCGASSASRLPTAEALDSYYRDYYKSAEISERVTFDDTILFGTHIARRVLKHLERSSLKILDFGGGDGAVSVRAAEYLIRNGFEKIDITVVDYNATLAATDDKRIFVRCHDSIDDLPMLEYDLVIASAVIEHIPRPREIIIRLINLMNNGGLLYVRTPWVLPFIKFSKSFGVRWDFTFPGHIHDLGQDFWEYFLARELSADHMSILESQPSPVETSFRRHFLRTVAAYTLKMPWHLFGRRYKLVGGWEVFARKNCEDVIGI